MIHNLIAERAVFSLNDSIFEFSTSGDVARISWL